ncbi:Na/Pi symporter [Gordonia otitidis]|uniref:Na/Pi symporter n=1 Tax=Gordonia otitidis TaxID=249058 RepID=UPI001D13C8B3|nr:Na/Pi symporter [Gordonia otitidis]UEA60758.1 Na/Pi symporter [Gordonia otitidis]
MAVTPNHRTEPTARRSVLRVTVLWLAVVLALLLLISAVSVIGRGFRLLGDDRAHQLFAFAGNPFVGLAVGVLATVIVQSSTTVTAIVVTAVGTGALTVNESVPIIMGSNVGTTVTCTFVALGFVGSREEFRRALMASTIHDFFNVLALVIFFPLELIFHPLARISGWLTDLLYGSSLPDPSNMNVIRWLTRPVVTLVVDVVGRIGTVYVGALLVVVVGIAMIFVAIRFLSRLLKVLMVGRARDALMVAVDRGPLRAMLTGFGVTVMTQSSTVTNTILVPFVGTGAITPKQVYPVTLGANLGTTLTALLAAFAVTGSNAKTGLQTALVHVVYNVAAVAVIFGIPFLRRIPLGCAAWLADRSVDSKRFLATYLVVVFIVLPMSVILLSLVF